MKRILYILLFMIGFLFILPQKGGATHLQGADIWYEYLGGNQYRVYLALYRDCAGQTMASTQTIYLESSCFPRTSFTATMVGTGTEVSPLCPASRPNSTCNGGTLPGTERYLYSVDVTINCTAPDWKFSWSRCCRNNAINNLTTTDDMYVEATLDNTQGNNNSPVFNNLPVPYICDGQLFSYNHGATDADGDVLVYSLVSALDAGAVPYAYNPPYSATYPVVTTTGTFPFNSSTGSMNFTPNGAQVCVVVVKVEEYRNGVLIGTTMRDMQIVVINCSTSPNQPIGSVINHSGGILTSNAGGYNIDVCTPGITISFDFPGTDADGDNIDMVSNDIATNIPGATWTVVGNNTTNPVGYFSWTPGPGDAGVHQFTISLTDDGCDIKQTNTYTITINVGSYVNAGPDRTYCAGSGTPAQLFASGGSSWTWTPATGLSCTNCQNPKASPAVTTTYTVTNNCGATDQVVVNVDNSSVSVSPSPSVDICLGSSQTLTATVSNCPSCTAANITWSPSANLSCVNCYTTTVTPTASQKYYVELNSGTCITRDSVQVNVKGFSVTASASTTEICSPSGSSTLHVSPYFHSGGNCNIGAFTCSGASTNVTIGTGTENTSYPTPFMGNYTSSRFQTMIRASELTAAGFNAGDIITSVAFNIATKNSTHTYNNFTIRMGCTTLNDLSGGYLNGLVEVYGPTDYNTTSGWNTFFLTQQMQWDGTSNIVIEVCYNSTSSSSNDPVMHTTGLGWTATIRNYFNNNQGCGITSDLSYTSRPNIRLSKCTAGASPYTYTWSPATGLSCTNCQSPTASPTATTTYTATVSDGVCSATDNVTINVSSVDAGPDVTICQGKSTTLNATYTGTPPIGTCGIFSGTYSGTATTTTIGTATTSTGSPTPYEGFWHDGRYQMLFLASELTAAGFQPGDVIQSIAFDIATKESSQPYNNFTIKMGCTNATSMTSTFITTGMVTVFTPKTVTTTTGWNTHTLDSPYQWDGVSNLVVEVCFDNTSYTSDDDVRYTTTSFTSVTYDFTDNDAGCSMNPSPSTSSSRANVRFGKRPAAPGPPTYIWSPATGLSCTNCQSPVASPTATTTYTVSVDNGYCTTTDNVVVSVTSPPPATAVWTGAVSTAWNDANNWNTCVPGCNTDVTIPGTAPNNPVIPAGYTAQVRHITIESGRGVDITNTGRLNVCGNFTGQAGWTGIGGTGLNRTVAFVGTTVQNFFDGSAVIFPNVVIDNASFVDLATNMNIGSTYTLSFGTNAGIIRTGTSEVNVMNNASTAITGYGANGYVQGNLRRAVTGITSYDFPVGNASFGYNLANITFTTAPTFSEVLGRFVTDATIPPTAPNVTECAATYNCSFGATFGKWIFDPNTAGTSTYTITLYPSIASPCATIGSRTVMKRPTGSTGPWLLEGTVCSGSTALYTRAGLTTFSEFAPTNAANPLPISELQFNGYIQNKTGVLEWLAIGEKGIQKYEVEKSIDNMQGFRKIGEIKAQSDQVLNPTYSFTDYSLATGNNYYRLHIIETDGNSYYSNIVNLVYDEFADIVIETPYPNPASEEIFIPVQTSENIKVYYEISNMLGQELLKGSETLNVGKIEPVKVNTSKLAKGVYLLEVKAGNASKVFKLVIE